MKDFKTVFSFYLYKELKSKSFIVVTAILCAISILSMVFLKIYCKEPKKDTIFVIDRTESLSEVWKDEAFPNTVGNSILDYSTLADDRNVEALSKIASDKNQSFLVFTEKGGDVNMNVIEDGDVSYTDINLLQSMIKQELQNKKLIELGISKEEAENIIPEVTIELTDASEDPSNFLVVLALFIVMIMFIILYSNSASSEVSYLKTNRVMEIIATSVKPVPLFLGLNFATSLIPFIQVAAAGVCMFLSKRILQIDFNSISSTTDVNLTALEPKAIAIYIVLFLLGYYIYSFINTSIVSIISKVEDVTTVTVPIAFIGMIQYFIGVTLLSKDNAIAAVCSYIPLTSSSMFIRYMYGYVGVGQVIIAIIILLITNVLLAYYGANLFKKGSTYYGNLKLFGKN